MWPRLHPNSKMNSETITSKVLFGTTDGNVSKKEFAAQRNLKNSIEFVESSTMGIRNGTSNNGSFIFNVFGGHLRVGDMTCIESTSFNLLSHQILRISFVFLQENLQS